MATVNGIFNSTGFNPSEAPDWAKKSFSGVMTYLQPSGSSFPLYGFTSQLKRETALNVIHQFFTKTMVFPECNTVGNLTDSATTWTVDSTAQLIPNMVLRVLSTNEMVIVNTILTGTTFTVTRAIGTVAAAAITSGTKVILIGSAFEESSLRPNARKTTPVQISNLTQIFRNTWALSGSAQAMQTITGVDEVAESKDEAAINHAMDIERSIIFGQKFSSTRNGQPFRLMDGLISIVSNLSYYPPSYSVANVSTAGSTTNYTQLQAMLDPCFNQGTPGAFSDKRMLLCGSTAFKVLNDIGRLSGQYQIVEGASSYGLRFKSFKIARGEFMMVEHPLFNTNTVWSKMALAVDLSTFNLAYLGGRDTDYKAFNADGKCADDNGIDAVGGTFTSELTLTLKNPPANAVIYNLTQGAAG